MIILLCVIFILIIVVGVFLDIRDPYCINGELLKIFGSLFLSVSIFIGVALFASYSRNIVIDKEINLYEDENLKIEQQISEIVNDYMTYESETFENVKGESLIALVSLYPELKSNGLVEKQIDIYVKNNKEIKKLKKEKLGLEVEAWWLFFGESKE